MPSPPERRSPAENSRKAIKRRKLILAPVLLGTGISCLVCGYLSWQEYIYPEEPLTGFRLGWWLQAEHGAGTGLGVMTAFIIAVCLYIFNRKRMLNARMGESPGETGMVLLRAAGTSCLAPVRQEQDRSFLLHEMPGE